MPEVLKPPHTGGGYFTRIFEKHPKFAIEVATIMQSWAMIEHELAELLVHMQGSGDARALMEIYFNIQSFDARLSAIQKIAALKLPQTELRQLELLSKAIRNAAKKRNIFAHVRWSENGTFPDGLIILPHSHQYFSGRKHVELWRFSDFEGASREIEQLSKRVDAFVHRVYQLASKPPRPTKQ